MAQKRKTPRPVDPTTIIGEILGEPAAQMRNPVNAGYLCPFIDSECPKRSHRIEGSYPICTIYKNGRPICVCPKRFFEVDFLKDVVDHCWPAPKPTNLRHAYEVKMSQFGVVDAVVADMDEKTGQVKDFISIEMQAVDITGSVEPAYNAVLNSICPMADTPTYNLNWANVRKRYITQLVNKGFFHHQWRTKIVCIIQTPLYESFRRDIHFDELSPTNSSSNIVFMSYDYKLDPDRDDGALRLVLDNIVGTSHNSLMMGILYQQAPKREDFCKKIASRLAG